MSCPRVVRFRARRKGVADGWEVLSMTCRRVRVGEESLQGGRQYFSPAKFRARLLPYSIVKLTRYRSGAKQLGIALSALAS